MSTRSLCSRRARLALEALEARNLPSTLPYGGIVSGAITSMGDSAFVDYTFSASKGDQYTLAMTSTPTSDGFSAYANLIAPSSTVADNFSATGQRAESADETGTYTVRVHDYYGTHTGTFTLGLEGINPISPNPTPLIRGGIVGGTIDAPLDVKQFTFTGQQGDDITLAMTSTATSSGFSAYANVYGPSGDNIDNFSATGQRSITLPESGTFMVNVHDYYFASKGAFTIGLEGTHPMSPSPTPLVPGGFVTGSITAPIDVRQFTFTASDGDLLGLSLTSTPTQPSFSAYANVYAPSGDNIDNFSATGLRYLTVHETGTYMVQLHDYYYTKTGTFKIGLEGIAPHSPDALALPAGQAVGGTITQTNDDVQYLFYGKQNDKVTVTMTSTADQASFSAYANVYGPSGDNIDNFSATTNRAITLPETGTFLIQVHDYYFAKKGHFTLRVDWAGPAASSISGTVYNDANANGSRQSTEAGLAGRLVYLDTNGNGSLDSGEPSAATDVLGNYAFTALSAGTYLVREVLGSGWHATNPSSSALSVSVGAGQNALGKSFGITQSVLATGGISGRVFSDVNGNGNRDKGELGLGLWRVYIDANNDGKFESNELSVLTDINGNWSFTGLIAGKYSVRLVPVSGTRITTPATGLHPIALTTGQKVTGKLFGVQSLT
jgi:hypothetical protein